MHYFLAFRPWHHDEMPAAFAFQSEVHACACDFPFLVAKGMRFFHADDITGCVLRFFHAITFSFQLVAKEHCR